MTLSHVAAALIALSSQELSGVAAQDEVAYASSTTILREDTLLCRDERYVVTSARGRIVQVRSPWGPLSEFDLNTVQSATESLMSASGFEIRCSTGRFNLTVVGRERRSGNLAGVSFWFEGGRLLPETADRMTVVPGL